MSIPYAKIEAIIAEARSNENGPIKDQYIHVSEMSRILQTLIDDDIAELDEMAKHFATQELLSPTVEEMEEINMISAEYDKARLEISSENT